MTFLLDVSVLIALIDPVHVAHNEAHEWFTKEGALSWATCPMTQNGVLRIIGNPKYPNTPGSPVIVSASLTAVCALPGHVFWADDISLIGTPLIDIKQILTSGQVTDTYLLALASAHGGKLATLDRRLSPKAVRNGATSLRVIGAR